MKIKISLIDDKNQMWEGDVKVVKIGSRKKSNQKQKSSKSLQRTSDSVR